jgi:hypothetical protein
MIDATAPHTRIDNAIIDDFLPKIGAYGLAVYTVLKRHLNYTTGQCNPSYNRIAKMIGIDRTTVIRKVRLLEKLGLIAVNLQWKEDGSPTSNHFKFAHAQAGTTAHLKSSTKPPPSPAEDNHPGRPAPPEQVFLNNSKLNKKKETPVTTDEKTEKQKNCPHPYAEVVRLSDGITVCNRCFDIVEFPLVA